MIIKQKDKFEQLKKAKSLAKPLMIGFLVLNVPIYFLKYVCKVRTI